jgi:hypothetical protein
MFWFFQLSSKFFKIILQIVDLSIIGLEETFDFGVF